MEILDLINNGSKQLRDKKIFSHKLDSEILLSKVLNKTREELAKEYSTKIESNASIDRVLARLDALDSKIDRILEAK